MNLFTLFLFFLQSSRRSKSQEQYLLQTSSLLFCLSFTVRSLWLEKNPSNPLFDLTSQTRTALVRRAQVCTRHHANVCVPCNSF